MERLGTGEIMKVCLETLDSLHGPGTRQVAWAILWQNTVS
jgi:hypothetical protein